MTFDFHETTRLLRTGGNDPTFRRLPDRIQLAFHTPDGPAALQVTDTLDAEAWGPGRDHALASVPDLLGTNRPAWNLPSHPRLDPIARAHPGLRLNDTGRVFEALVITVLQQLVTWEEAVAAYRNLVQANASAAPGPLDLLLPPTPRQLRSLSLAHLASYGIARKRAITLKNVAERAGRLEAVRTLTTPEAMQRLCSVPGIGPWTSASVLGHRLARSDVLLLGDYHLPNTVAWALDRVPRGTDAEMVERLRPFPGQEFRVLRLLYAASIRAPRRGARRQLRFR